MNICSCKYQCKYTNKRQKEICVLACGKWDSQQALPAMPVSVCVVWCAFGRFVVCGLLALWPLVACLPARCACAVLH